MSISNEERFHELAHKLLAKEAQPFEHSELKALIGENSKLQDEFERMGAEGVAAREILALLEDVQHPMPGAPPPPMAWLRNEIGEVFKPGASSQSELSQILGKLEQWAGRMIGAERERVLQLVSMLRRSIDAGHAEPDIRLRIGRSEADSILFCNMVESAVKSRLEESNYRLAEFESRLRQLEKRIQQAEQITHQCSHEVQALLHAVDQERKASEQWRRQNPDH